MPSGTLGQRWPTGACAGPSGLTCSSPGRACSAWWPTRATSRRFPRRLAAWPKLAGACRSSRPSAINGATPRQARWARSCGRCSRRLTGRRYEDAAKLHCPAIVPSVTVIKAVTFDAADALVLARFWAAVLGSDVDEESTADKAFVEAPGWGGRTCGSPGFLSPRRPRTGCTSTCRAPGAVEDEVTRLERAGAAV